MAFVVFDGIDGSGKTTQAERFRDFCQVHGLRTKLYGDPGCTSAGSKIREILLNKEMPLVPISQAMLFAAARANLFNLIQQESAELDMVICDRWIMSTLAYQHHLLGVDRGLIMDMFMSSCSARLPNLYFVFDVDANTALRRKAGKPPHLGKCAAPGCKREVELPTSADRYESMGEVKQETIRQGFLTEAPKAGWTECIVLDANHSPEVLGDLVQRHALRKFRSLFPEPVAVT